MKNSILRIFVIAFILIIINGVPGFAQAKEEQAPATTEASQQVSKLSFSFGMDLVSRYLWRGSEFGVGRDGSSSPHFQPTAAFSYDLGKAGSLSLGVWGSYAFNGNFSESDVFFNYTIPTKSGTFSLTFNDYYYPYLGIPVTNFDGKGEGAHTIDAQLAYTFPESFPLTFMVSNNVHNDMPDNKSLYLEASYPFSVSGAQLGVIVGAAQGVSSWHGIYTDKFELCNIGLKASKSIRITQDYSLPVGMNWIYNAHIKKTYVVFKVTL